MRMEALAETQFQIVCGTTTASVTLSPLWNLRAHALPTSSTSGLSSRTISVAGLGSLPEVLMLQKMHYTTIRNQWNQNRTHLWKRTSAASLNQLVLANIDERDQKHIDPWSFSWEPHSFLFLLLRSYLSFVITNVDLDFKVKIKLMKFICF